MASGVVACAECNQAAQLAEWERLGRCPNPACRPGLYFEQLIRVAYKRACAEVDKRIEADLTKHGGLSITVLARPYYPPEPRFEGVQPTLWPYIGPYPDDD